MEMPQYIWTISRCFVIFPRVYEIFFLWEHFLTGFKPHFHAQAHIYTETVYTVYPRSSFYLTIHYSTAHWWVSHHYTPKHGGQ